MNFLNHIVSNTKQQWNDISTYAKTAVCATSVIALCVPALLVFQQAHDAPTFENCTIEENCNILESSVELSGVNTPATMLLVREKNEWNIHAYRLVLSGAHSDVLKTWTYDKKNDQLISPDKSLKISDIEHVQERNGHVTVMMYPNNY